MASISTNVFSPYDVTVTLSQDAFSHIVGGYSEDTIIEFERTMDTYELYAGADNTNTFVHKPNDSGKLTIHLQQSSASNDILTALYEKAARSRDITGMFSVTVKDTSGRSVIFSSEAIIGKLPAVSYGNSMQVFQWEILMSHASIQLGGNGKLSPEDVSAYESFGNTLDSKWIQ